MRPRVSRAARKRRRKRLAEAMFPERAPLPPHMLRPEDAAEFLGMGLTSFKKYVAPDVRAVRRGSLVLYGVPELKLWAEENAEAIF